MTTGRLTLRHAAIAAAAVFVLGGVALLADAQQSGSAVAPATASAGAPAPASAAQAVPGAKPAAPGIKQAVPGQHPAPKVFQKALDKPLWRDLSHAQQVALEPLAGEWDQMDGVRKRKWLEMANRFATMKPEEQQRVHERMRDWIKLTPAQRKLARDTYKRTRKLAPEQKTATWQSYQQLPDEQKKKLAAAAAARHAAGIGNEKANGKAAARMRAQTAACPAGMVKNPLSATPACVPAPAPAPAPVQPAASPAPASAPAAPAPAAPAPTTPATPAASPSNAN